jgi:hypothetical protein
MQATGDMGDAGSLIWSVSCASSAKELLKVRVASTVDGVITVPDSCPAQRLDLSGSAPELPKTVDATMSHLDLTRDRAGG